MAMGDASDDRFWQALQELWRRHTADQDADDAQSEIDERAPQLRALWDRTVARLRRNASTLLFFQPPDQDLVVPAGEPFVLWARLPPMEARAGHAVRFRCGDRVLAEVPIRAPEVWAQVGPDDPGVYRISAEAVGRGGRRLGFGGQGWEQIVHVVGPEPVVVVDADLALKPDPPATGLANLVAAGVQIAWVDLGEERRVEAIRQAIQEGGLPEGAVFSFPRHGQDFATLGVDFRQVLAREAARRGRAMGVPLVGLVTDHPDHFADAQNEDMRPIAPAELTSGDAPVEALQHAARALHERRKESHPISFQLDERTRAPVVAGNRCRVELDNRRAREAVLSALEAAERDVGLQVYMFEDGRFTDVLGAHLVRAARRGVRVRVLVDALYSGEQALGMSNPILRTLRREPGIEVLANRPLAPADALDLLPLKERDHRKMLVVDGTRAFVTGRNVGDFYYTGFDEVAITDYTPHERVPWLDAHVELTGPLVAQLERAFAEAWRDNGGEPPAAGPVPAPTGSTHGRLVLHRGPQDANAMAAYEALLDAARDHVLIVNDFTIVSTLALAVRRALARGVEVTLLTGNAVPRRGDGTFLRGPVYRELFDHVTKQRLEVPMRLGLAVYELATDPALPLVVCTGGTVRPYVHAKVVTADGCAMSVGSANLDATASFWEQEANVVLEDPSLVGEVEAEIGRLLHHSLRIDPDSPYWSRDRVLRGLVDALWPDLLYS